MYTPGSNTKKLADNVDLTIGSLRVFFVKFDRRWQNWGQPERNIYQDLLAPLNELPCPFVRRGINFLRTKFKYQDDAPAVEVIIDTILKDTPVERDNRSYRPDVESEQKFLYALNNGDWEEMKRVRTLLANHDIAHLRAI